jgi:membrane protease YdiL (CAAX protease family)
MTTADTAVYWHETRRPWVNLVFIAPWLVLYEAGVWLSGHYGFAARNGADAWLRMALDRSGWPLAWLLPVVVLVTLWGWHRAVQEPCRVRRDTLAGMAAESVLFACGLILVGQLIDRMMRSSDPLLLSTGYSSIALRFVNFLGAGLYEEFLFRLCLIPLGYAVLRGLLMPQRIATGCAIVATSLVFALAHYLTPTGDTTVLSLFTDAVARVQTQRELWFGFAFRLIAGGYFAAIYCTRGFGIAVGCHALYDVIVGIVLISEL